MAFSAFKSTTRRGNTSPSSSAEEKKVPNRRSRSVSAMPRTGGWAIPPPENTKPSAAASDEFLIKRDNPLFCSSSLSSSSSSSGSETAASVVGGYPGRRERSVSSLGRKPERSLSRADTGRRWRMQSLPREPCGRFDVRGTILRMRLVLMQYMKLFDQKYAALFPKFKMTWRMLFIEEILQ